MGKLLLLSTVWALFFVPGSVLADQSHGLQIALRAEYTARHDASSDMPEGAVLSLIGARRVSGAIDVFGAASYFVSSEDVRHRVCPTDQVGCPSDIEDADIGALSFGLRFRPISSSLGGEVPYIELAPMLYYGHWTSWQRTFTGIESEKSSMDRIFGGFQANLVIPIRVTDRIAMGIGLGYLESQNVDRELGFPEEIRGFRHFKVSWTISSHL